MGKIWTFNFFSCDRTLELSDPSGWFMCCMLQNWEMFFLQGGATILLLLVSLVKVGKYKELLKLEIRKYHWYQFYHNQTYCDTFSGPSVYFQVVTWVLFILKGGSKTSQTRSRKDDEQRTFRQHIFLAWLCGKISAVWRYISVKRNSIWVNSEQAGMELDQGSDFRLFWNHSQTHSLKETVEGSVTRIA